MADAPEDDELLLTETADEAEVGQGDEDQEEQGSAKPGDEGEEELEITFGDEAAPASGERETGLVKHLRDEIRKRDALLAERPSAPQIEVGEKPTIAGCEYDEQRYETELEAWRDRKAQAEQAKAQSEQAGKQARDEYERDEQSYRDKRARLPFADVDEVEGVALAALSQVQKAAIVMTADDPAKVFYALGRHPAKLAELSQIQNPLKLAAAVARLEGALKVMPKRRAPDPEEIPAGNAGVRHGKDKELERLEKEADRTGDRTKLREYRAGQRAKAA